MNNDQENETFQVKCRLVLTCAVKAIAHVTIDTNTSRSAIYILTRSIHVTRTWTYHADSWKQGSFTALNKAPLTQYLASLPPLPPSPPEMSKNMRTVLLPSINRGWQWAISHHLKPFFPNETWWLSFNPPCLSLPSTPLDPADLENNIIKSLRGFLKTSHGYSNHNYKFRIRRLNAAAKGRLLDNHIS